ncbi:MAG: hypothetical protein R6V55_11640 [Desulfovermiculus sp.]
MLKKIVGALCLAACICAPAHIVAQDVKEFAVAPFQVHGPEKYQYLQQGIQSMLVSRLTWEGRLVPQETSDLKAVQSESQARSVQQDLGVDFLVWGNMTIAGEEANISAFLLGEESKTFSRSTPMGQLIPALEDISGRMTGRIFPEQRESESEKDGEKSDPDTEQTQDASQRVNENFVYQDDASNQEELNPQFEYTGYQSSQGRWRSQSLSVTGLNMVVADADADDDNEIFVLAEHGVKAYSIEDNKLSLISEYKTNVRTRCLNLNTIDLNRDGYLELVASAMQGERVTSFVLNFKDGQFQEVEKDINFYMNVVRQPPDYKKTLIGQRKGKSEIFDSQVQAVVRMNDKLSLERKINLPSRSNVFNFAYLPYKNAYKTIVVNSNDRLQVFNHNNQLEHVTSKAYAASAQGIPMDKSFPGLGESIEDPTRFYFIPSRLVPCNLDRDEEFELLVNRNVSMAAQFFTRYRYFPKGEIHSLFWDGMGLAPQWSTRPINGTVVDYGIADINNDGNQELYVCATTHPGLTGFKKRKTVVYAYALNQKKGEEKGVNTEGFYLQSGEE